MRGAIVRLERRLAVVAPRESERRNRPSTVAVLLGGLVVATAMSGWMYLMDRRVVVVAFVVRGRLSHLIHGLAAAEDLATGLSASRTIAVCPLGAVPTPAVAERIVSRGNLKWVKPLILQQAVMFLPPGLARFVWIDHQPRRLSSRLAQARDGNYWSATEGEFTPSSPVQRRTPHVVMGFHDATYHKSILSSRQQRAHRAHLSDLGSLVDAIQAIRARGIQVLRVSGGGTRIDETPLADLVIDVDKSLTGSRELEVVSRAEFTWADATGLWWLAAAIKRPVLITNLYSLARLLPTPSPVVYVPSLTASEDGTPTALLRMVEEEIARHLDREGKRAEPRYLTVPSVMLEQSIGEMLSRVAGRHREPAWISDARQAFEESLMRLGVYEKGYILSSSFIAMFPKLVA